MKIATSARGAVLSSELDPRFGRAACFVVVDTESGQSSVHDNSQNVQAAQGAGIRAAQDLAKLGVEAVVTGSIGPNAAGVLGAANIKV